MHRIQAHTHSSVHALHSFNQDELLQLKELRFFLFLSFAILIHLSIYIFV